MLRRATVVAGLGAALMTFAAPVLAGTTGTVTSMSPGYGPVGTRVAIHGNGLKGATAVRFHSLAAAFTVVSDSEVVATVPAGATSGLVAVITPSGKVVSPSPFTVQKPTSATITRSAASVVAPGSATISGTLVSQGHPVAQQLAVLQRSAPSPVSWYRVQSAERTSATGQVSWSVAPRVNALFRVVFRESPAYLGGHTGWRRVVVRPVVALRAPSVAPTRTPLRFSGFVWPGKGGKVALQRFRDGGWHTAAVTTLDSTGHYRFPVQFGTTGDVRYRVRRASDAVRGAGLSGPHRVTVVQRTLTSGMSGPDVLALQRRLAALHYDVGALSGTYGYDTQHAVTAFEKLQGLTRDGVAGLSVWQRLVHPYVPHLLHPYTGTSSIEVDLTRQVVYYAVDGRIARILDASTGGGYYYYGTDGSLQQAITPTGHWSVVYKVDHWVTAPLGTLYRPAYFNYAGYALHGEGLVPPYPASHGCVRITVPAMDRMYDNLFTGMSVWIYRS